MIIIEVYLTDANMSYILSHDDGDNSQNQLKFYNPVYINTEL